MNRISQEPTQNKSPNKITEFPSHGEYIVRKYKGIIEKRVTCGSKKSMGLAATTKEDNWVFLKVFPELKGAGFEALVSATKSPSLHK